MFYICSINDVLSLYSEVDYFNFFCTLKSAKFQVIKDKFHI
jgi:hypothetical protein